MLTNESFPFKGFHYAYQSKFLMPMISLYKCMNHVESKDFSNRLAYEEIMSEISLINEPCPGTPFGINDYRKFK